MIQRSISLKYEPASDPRFHTGFIENNTLVLTKPQVDGANRDLQNQVSSLLSNDPRVLNHA